jgi:MFS family permease
VHLCVAAAFAYGSYAMCRSPVLPLFARSLGAGPPLIGLIVGASTLTGIVVKLPAGALSDVWGRRALLLCGAGFFAVMPAAYLAVTSVGLLLALRFVHGNATAMFGPVASAALSDLAPVSHRGAWLGTYSAVQGAGQAIGPVLAGALIAANHFERAFAASAALGVVALALIATWPATASTGPPSHRWATFRQGIAEVVGDSRILLISLAQAAQFFLNGTLNAFLPLYAKDVAGLDALQIGLLFGVQTVTTLAVRPLFGVVSDRMGRRLMIAGGLVNSGLAIGAVSQVSDFRSLLVTAAWYGAALSLTTSATSAYITDLTPRTRYGAAHGTFGTIYDVGDACGPISAGVLVAAVGYRQTFAAMAAAAIVLAVGFVWASRRWKGQAVESPA